MKMKKYALVIASISLVCLMCRPVFARSLALNGDLPRQSPETGAIPVHYAEETELVAVVCHLAGISGYVFNEEDGVLPDYLADVDSTFAGFRDHKAVKFASSKMFRKGFAWDMPMAFALRPWAAANPPVNNFRQCGTSSRNTSPPSMPMIHRQINHLNI